MDHLRLLEAHTGVRTTVTLPQAMAIGGSLQRAVTVMSSVLRSRHVRSVTAVPSGGYLCVGQREARARERWCVCVWGGGGVTKDWRPRRHP